MKNIYSLFWILIWNYLFIGCLSAEGKTDSEIINLAHTLYTSGYSVETDAIQKHDHCGYSLSQQLAQALRSPRTSLITKETVMMIASSALPEFNQYISTNNLDIYFTDIDLNPNQNISVSNVQDLATHMQNSFDTLFSQFGKVATNSNGRLKVYIYDLGDGLYGFTNSLDNKIHLNSTVMQVECFRKTTGAHELFHRFQFAYGLDKEENEEPNQEWWVESSADWAMHYCFSNEFDYILSGNDFLIDPNLPLFTRRSYEANLMWIYLGERCLARYDALIDEAFIMKQILMAYEQGARNKNLISSVTRPFLNQSAWNFMQDWHETNGLIGRNGLNEKYLYADENNTTDNCGAIYQFLPVPIFETIAISSNEFTWTSEEVEVNKGGAVYHQFNISSGVTRLDLGVRGLTSDAKYVVSLIGLKDNIPLLFLRDNEKSSKFALSWNSDEYDQFLLVVASRKKSGTYFIEII